MRTRIKICGLTNIEAAQCAAHSGADAIGLMFYEKSSRFIDISTAHKIKIALPPFISTVAVFANASEDAVKQVIDAVSPDYLQFHGDETELFCRQYGLPYIRAIQVKSSSNLLQREAEFQSSSAILLDSDAGDRYGGTGKQFDWGLGNYGGTKPVILAGGLTPENITDAIAASKPFAVDVSSGVETNGTKDLDKIRQFCHNVQHNTV